MSEDTLNSQSTTSEESDTDTLEVLAWPGFTSQNGNPYTRLLYESMEAEAVVEVEGFDMFEPLTKRYDIWHVHWPDDLLSYPSRMSATFYVLAELVLFAWARLCGTRLIWTTHDLGPHESYHPWLEKLFWAVFIPMVDGIVSLSETAQHEAYRRFPDLRSVPSAVVPHGHYRTAYPDPVPKNEARRRLDVPQGARVAVFVGRIRPYKNVVPLIQTFREWPDPDARLLVAGNPISDDLSWSVRRAAEGDERVRVDLRFIEVEEIPVYLGAADLVVLPYETIMQSGSALLGLSFDRPVVVPDRGAMSEIQARVGKEWIRTYEGSFTVDLLTEAMEWAESESRGARAPVEDLEWPRLARKTAALYRQAIEAHG